MIKGLQQVADYLDDVIVFDSDPRAYVQTVRPHFERLRNHKAFALEGSIGRHRCELPGPRHFPSVSTPKRGISARIGQNASA